MVQVSSAEANPPRNIFKQFLQQTSKDYLLGIALLLVVVFLWTASGFVTQVGGCHLTVYPYLSKWYRLSF